MKQERKSEKKLLNFMLTLALAVIAMIGLLPGMTMTAHADDEAANVTINGTTTSYNALDNAVTALNAAADGAKLTLLKDIDTTSQISITGTKMIDFNGKTLTSTAGNSAIILDAANTNLTVIDDSGSNAGKITYSASDSDKEKPAIIVEAGTLNIDSGTVISTNGDAIRVNGGVVNVTGGIVQGAYSGVLVPNGQSGTVNINGGTIIGGKYGNNAIGLYGDGTFNLSGDANVTASMGIYTGKSYTGEVTISGGTINASSASQVNSEYSLNAKNKSGQVKITGGTFNKVVVVSAEKDDGSQGSGLKNVIIEGGIFNKGLKVENYSWPVIRGGQFRGDLDIANWGPYITGGVFEKKEVTSSNDNRKSLEAYLEEGYAIVGLTDETYKYGVVASEGVTPSINIVADPEGDSKTFDGTGVKLTAECAAAVSTKGTDAEDVKTYNIANTDWTYGWTKDENTEPLGSDAVFTTEADVSATGTYKCTADFTASATNSSGTTTITGSNSDSKKVSINSKIVTNPVITLEYNTHKYTGDPLKPNVTAVKETADGPVIPDTEYKVEYSDNTDAGRATVTISDKEGGNYSVSGSTTFEITKADPTAAAPTGLEATYGQTLADVLLTNPEGNTSGTWAWKDAEETSVGNAGDRTFKANFTPTDTKNYTSKEVDVTIKVNKASNPATINSDDFEVMQGGNTIDLSKNVVLNEATGNVTYEICGDAIGCTVSSNGTLTSGADTGSVTVNVIVAADENYMASEAMPLKVKIIPKNTQTITADDMTVTYGDTDQKVSAEVTEPETGGGAISYAVKEGSEGYIDVASDGLLMIKKVPADGKAYVTVTAAETSSYAEATKNVTITIQKKAITVKVKDQTIKAGETVPDLSAPVQDEHYTVTGLVEPDVLTTGPTLEYASEPDNTKEGTYIITAKDASAGENYEISYEEGTLTISPSDEGDSGQIEPSPDETGSDGVDPSPADGGGTDPSPADGGSTDEDMVKQVVDQINALTEPYDPVKAKAVLAAYDKLTDAQKKDARFTDKVMKKLADMKEAVAAAEAQDAAGKVIRMIRALPGDSAKAGADQVAEAVAAYKELSDTARQLITGPDLEKLQTAMDYPATALKAKIKSVKIKKGKKAVVKWKKLSLADGYQLCYKAKGVKGKTVEISGVGTLKKAVRKLKAGKKYTFKVRTYMESENLATRETIKVYGQWSKARKAKVKR